jgi:hypothetical protein
MEEKNDEKTGGKERRGGKKERDTGCFDFMRILNPRPSESICA